MWIDNLEIKGLRGFNFNLSFQRGVNIFYGTNGCGKTTLLEVIAKITGNDFCTINYLPDAKFEYIKLIVKDEDGWTDKSFVFEARDHFDVFNIYDFKTQLPARTSFVLRHDLDDGKGVFERREPFECHANMLKNLRAFQIPLQAYLSDQMIRTFVSETGGQRYLLTTGMRRAPEHVPMFIENPDRHLHIMLKRVINDFYQASLRQQIFYTSHDISFICAGWSNWGDQLGGKSSDSIFDLPSMTQ